jgi:hypothetical protein
MLWRLNDGHHTRFTRLILECDSEFHIAEIYGATPCWQLDAVDAGTSKGVTAPGVQRRFMAQASIPSGERKGASG